MPSSLTSPDYCSSHAFLVTTSHDALPAVRMLRIERTHGKISIASDMLLSGALQHNRDDDGTKTSIDGLSMERLARSRVQETSQGIMLSIQQLTPAAILGASGLVGRVHPPTIQLLFDPNTHRLASESEAHDDTMFCFPYEVGCRLEERGLFLAIDLVQSSGKLLYALGQRRFSPSFLEECMKRPLHPFDGVLSPCFDPFEGIPESATRQGSTALSRERKKNTVTTDRSSACDEIVFDCCDSLLVETSAVLLAIMGARHFVDEQHGSSFAGAKHAILEEKAIFSGFNYHRTLSSAWKLVERLRTRSSFHELENRVALTIFRCLRCNLALHKLDCAGKQYDIAEIIRILRTLLRVLPQANKLLWTEAAFFIFELIPKHRTEDLCVVALSPSPFMTSLSSAFDFLRDLVGLLPDFAVKTLRQVCERTAYEYIRDTLSGQSVQPNNCVLSELAKRAFDKHSPCELAASALFTYIRKLCRWCNRDLKRNMPERLMTHCGMIVELLRDIISRSQLSESGHVFLSLILPSLYVLGLGLGNSENSDGRTLLRNLFGFIGDLVHQSNFEGFSPRLLRVGSVDRFPCPSSSLC